MPTKAASELLLPKTYEDVWYRGEAYVERGLVKIAKKDKKEVRALVSGNSEYVVSLSYSGGGLVRKCTCPYVAGGARSPACKHMVAVAIVWDEERHLGRPSREEIETKTITPPLVSRFDIERALQEPLRANLEVLRLAASENTAGRTPHARLPLSPVFITDKTTALDQGEVKKAVRSILRWARVPGYDAYLCSGEMIAAFCELLRSIRMRVSATPALGAADILRDLQKAHYAITLEEIDNSDGFHAVTEAHLDDIRDAIKKSKTSKEDAPFLEQKLWNYEVNKDKYE